MPPIDLAASLRFEPERGQIHLQDYRMVLLSACALGAMRRELIETLGPEQARGVMKRFGHAAGLADGLALAKLFPNATKSEHHELGPALHGLEGVAKVEVIPELTHINPENGELHIEAYWQDSYEAEQHLELFGPSEQPVCWTLVGYATGHSSSASGDRTVVIETECRAMGAERCRFTLGYAKDMPREAALEEPDYEKQHLPKVLQSLLDQINTQSKSLLEGERKINRLESELSRYRPADKLVGESPSFKEALATARTVAPVDATVLVLGESGTGKEGLARLIHDQSLRSAHPFVAVNCSALPETLQEAELFGYAKGAFTGATSSNHGLFEAAHKGTLFLDEVGDLSLTAQTKILRAVQEGEIKRLGETRTRRVDVRVVAATHRDLKAMVANKTFREDLFYRLSVIAIAMPPLRERGHDRLLLADFFLRGVAHKLGRAQQTLTREAKQAIATYPWPGNVRELQNAVERAVILSTGEQVQLADLPPEIVAFKGGAQQWSADEKSTTHPNAGNRAPLAPTPGSAALQTVQAHLQTLPDERARIQAALSHFQGNRELAAKALATSRTTLWRRMRKLGLIQPA